MERRYQARVPLTIEVDLYRQQRYIGKGETENVSGDGVFVNLDKNQLSDDLRGLLTLKFRHGQKDDICALVIHHHSEGVGLMVRNAPN